MLLHTQLQYLIVFLLASSIQYEGKKSSKAVYFLSSNTTFNPIYATHYAMTICRDNKVADITMGLTNAFTSDTWFHISITLMTNDRLRSTPMFKYDLNICELLAKKGTKRIGFITPWIRNFWSHGNLPQSCPVQEGNYSWIGLNMENLNIPSIIPRSKYVVVTTAYVRTTKQRDMVGNLSLLIELK